MPPEGFQLKNKTRAVATAAAAASRSAAPEKSSSRTLTVEDFELVKTLGQGSFGRVLLVRCKGNGKFFAMKILWKKVIEERNQVHGTLIFLRVHSVTALRSPLALLLPTL